MTSPERTPKQSEIIQQRIDCISVFMLVRLNPEERKALQERVPDEIKALIPEELVNISNYDEIERYATRNLTPLQAQLSYIANGIERGYASAKGDFNHEDQIGYNIPYQGYTGLANPR